MVKSQSVTNHVPARARGDCIALSKTRQHFYRRGKKLTKVRAVKVALAACLEGGSEVWGTGRKPEVDSGLQCAVSGSPSERWFSASCNLRRKIKRSTVGFSCNGAVDEVDEDID